MTLRRDASKTQPHTHPMTQNRKKQNVKLNKKNQRKCLNLTQTSWVPIGEAIFTVQFEWRLTITNEIMTKPACGYCSQLAGRWKIPERIIDASAVATRIFEKRKMINKIFAIRIKEISLLKTFLIILSKIESNVSFIERNSIWTLSINWWRRLKPFLKLNTFLKCFPWLISNRINIINSWLGKCRRIN